MGELLDRLAADCNADAEFGLAARYWTGSLRIDLGTECADLVLGAGRVTGTRPASGALPDEPGLVGVHAAAELWDLILAPVPGAYLNDILPAMAAGLVQSGNTETFWQYYPAVRRAVDLLRIGRHGPAPSHSPAATRGERSQPSGPVRFDSPQGRYVHLDLPVSAIEGDGSGSTVSGAATAVHRIYFEEAGNGIPLLCQHTAGAHGSQWRHLFEAPEVTDHFRLIAYDLPFHGKSLPPDGTQWWAAEYRLTVEAAMAVPLALAEALQLDKPVFMGCSIGGLVALDLARYHPDAFRAVIAVEPALKVEGDRAALAGFWHPRVSNEFKATAMYGLMAPQSPEARRRETVFVYSQGWPQAFLGDLHLYIDDHDLRHEAAHIDTSRCAVHMLSGEYDYSATVHHGRAAHEAIPGSTFDAMAGIGHFPMSEDPERFLRHLGPVLAKIRESAG
jgi:pimeloyl-ACP methyl ester carboxylesterase